MPKRISAVKTATSRGPAGRAASKRNGRDKAGPVSRVVIVTMDNHLAASTRRATAELLSGPAPIELTLHSASTFCADKAALARCIADIEAADIVIVTMLFLEDQFTPVKAALQARRDRCDALVACMSASEVVKLTHMGRLNMAEKQGGALSFLKRFRKPSKGAGDAGSGKNQMAMLRRLPRILRFIPGTAQDLRAYFLTMQYWLACSDENLVNMVRMLVDRYASGDRASLRGAFDVAPPKDYPDIGVYHPSIPGRVAESAAGLPKPKRAKGTVGLVLMRAYVLAGDTAHYDSVIALLEERGLAVIPIFSSGLDNREAIDAFFKKDGRSIVGAVVSLTGFSLVGGPAYNNSAAAEAALSDLDAPYVAAQALEFQSLEEWRASERGLSPVETTMMVAIPELDGARAPMVFGGRSTADGPDGADQQMRIDPERAALLADRVTNLVALRRSARAERRLAVTLFGFPPNAGATGTAAYLDVYGSLFNLLKSLKAEGYSVEMPESVDALRNAVLGGNSDRFGTDANVFDRVLVDDHVRREPHLAEIEAQWGPAPGKHQTDGGAIQILGAAFGNVLVGVQPSFGYEDDPMRLLFAKGFAPTHAFSAYYRYLREDWRADAVLHFGTHGALEFMPGKQTGLSGACWPERLIGALPNFYLYAANNPSEGLIAKRRSAATLITYLTPPMRQAGLYKGLTDLKESIDRRRALGPDQENERARLAEAIQAQAAQLDLAVADPAWKDVEGRIAGLQEKLAEVEKQLIPEGLHIVGEIPDAAARAETLSAIAEALPETEDETAQSRLDDIEAALQVDSETPALIKALDGGFIPPAPGGDLLRNPDILPTGRNMHGFDPFRIPSAFALMEGKRQADQLLDRHLVESKTFPRSVALVLWGADNLKSEGTPICQALALMGAKPRHDSFGRLAGAELIPLEQLGRPRVDVVMTLSGIFRDLLPMQIKLLAEAARLAAEADEPAEMNAIRANTRAHMQKTECDFETASLRVFSNADGAYGSNVNMMVDNGQWEDEADLGGVFTQRKCFAYGAKGAPQQNEALLKTMLSGVDFAYQNLESVELGVTSIDHYFDSLGGIARAASEGSGRDVPVYISDQTREQGAIRTLNEQVSLETRTRMLNPAWYDAMLKHGYEGVRQIEAHITNTVGWSATTGQVDPWVYHKLTETFVLDEAMRDRMASLNAKASVRVANRLIEAHERQYWTPDEDTLEALRQAGDELEDRLEGVGTGGIAA